MLIAARNVVARGEEGSVAEPFGASLGLLRRYERNRTRRAIGQASGIIGICPNGATLLRCGRNAGWVRNVIAVNATVVRHALELIAINRAEGRAVP
jgi:hypothetical protein